MSPDVSVVLCTWNRAPLLAGALDTLVAQTGAPAYEVILVDNASTDATPSIVARYVATHPCLRYAREDRPGLSHARNTGVHLSRGRIVAFTDDDVRVRPEWLRELHAAFGRHPDAACIGGPVLPAWPDGRVPAWLTERHWAPLGVQHYGADELRVDAARPLCLIGGNLAFRREALEAVGPFDPSVQRVGNGSGSTEDHEYHIRLWQSGRHGIYSPRVRVDAVVTPARIAKSHHRVWHYGHGRHVARMRLPEVERSRRHIFGAPAHLLRQAVRDAREWAALALRRDEVAAFEREVRLWFAAGFLRERWG